MLIELNSTAEYHFTVGVGHVKLDHKVDINNLVYTMPVVNNTCTASNGNIEDTFDIPIIDVQEYMNNGETAQDQCKKVVESLRQHGILIVKDIVS